MNKLIEIVTRHYEFAHGKKPRGVGSWYFQFDLTAEQKSWNGSYGSAKKWAVQYAREKGYTYIEVCS